jgi:uncharacterized protein (UPF0332 family)
LDVTRQERHKIQYGSKIKIPYEQGAQVIGDAKEFIASVEKIVGEKNVR